MARRGSQGASFNPLGWMFTFSDLVTLLLTFFVMLLSMKEPEITKLQAAFGLFSQGPGSFSITDRARVPDVQHLLESLRQPSVSELMSPEQQLARQLELPPTYDPGMVSRLQGQVTLRQEERGPVITLANDLLFSSGSAELSPQAKAAIQQAAELLRPGDAPISVEGNTDDIPPLPGGPYQDNWDLSLARAMAVLDQLVTVEKIPAARLRVAALGDTRPLVPNNSPANRAMNRRTEIVLLVTAP